MFHLIDHDLLIQNKWMKNSDRSLVAAGGSKSSRSVYVQIWQFWLEMRESGSVHGLA